MGIERKEWVEKFANKVNAKRREAPVQVRSVEMSGVWEDFMVWLHGQVEAKEEEAIQALNTFQRSGDYSHVALVTHKSLLDIRQAEMLLLQNIEAKVLDYHKME